MFCVHVNNRMSETFYADFVGKLLIVLHSFRFAHHTLTIRFTLGSIPPPIKYLVDNYYMPDFENVAMNMRDAPTLASKPNLKRVPCCRIPFCFPCMF